MDIKRLYIKLKNTKNNFNNFNKINLTLSLIKIKENILHNVTNTFSFLC